ncbi:DUF4301 family protein [Robiginitalea sp.]|nr:DUF4301 family protein [Robiginitalea sp.]
MEEALKQSPSNLVKVVLFGPESTGKTTLAQELAAYYNTHWVPEYAREYLQVKWDRVQRTCEPEDLLPIARGQMRLENEMSAASKDLLICDTDLLETKVYSEAYYLGYCDTELEQHALENKYDLYFLTYIDVPWEQDDLRDRPDKRREMFDYFKAALDTNRRKYVLLQGNRDERRRTAIAHIDKLLAMKRFTNHDLQQLNTLGISAEKAAEQIAVFKQGIRAVRLEHAAVVGKGIVRLNETDQQRFKTKYRGELPEKLVLKFVPASGAASRMFKVLFEFLETFNPESDNLEIFVEQPKWKGLKQFRDGLSDFPFYHLVTARIGSDGMGSGKELYAFVREMLAPEGLNYGFFPKGMLPFHNYGENLSTPFEEHLREAAAHASSKGTAVLHFTISEAHRPLFENEFTRICERVTAETGCRFKVSYSYQKAATDTLAVTPENEPFRDQEGNLLFRPGGHGALIENLDEQQADLIFIKNIDNVTIRANQPLLTDWKEILGGYLLDIQMETFNWLHQLDDASKATIDIEGICRFVETKLNTPIPDGFTRWEAEAQRKFLHDCLNRPIRVCGMVKNEGEPGGGPFWVRAADGKVSLQIVESAQVDLSDASQQELFNGATHFNPVDLVCGVCDYKGQKFKLIDYVDSEQGFITDKTFEGRNLKAMELPGLWNGAMAFWNTVFVEVPIATFNPVKTVNDLLKPAHQG